MMLTLDNVHVAYGPIRALHGVSMTIDEGEIVTLIGANGAGKSTTLRAISGLVHANVGKIIFEGKDITQMSSAEIVRLGIGHSPEGRRVFANMTVRENLELGAYCRKDRAGIREDLERAL